jgi:hypothetical protein
MRTSMNRFWDRLPAVPSAAQREGGLLVSAGPSSRALARPNALRPRKVDIGPAQVVVFTVFFLFCFFLFSFLKLNNLNFEICSDFE